MAQNTVNTGTTANDGTGDPLRSAFIKINEDITELFSDVANNAANIASLVITVDTADGELLALSSIAFDTANQAYDFSNAQYTAMNAAFTMANTVNSLFYGAVVNSTAAFAMANSTVVRTSAVYALTNSGYTVANAAFNLANTLNPTALSIIANATAAFDQSNLAFQLAGQAYDGANAGISLATGAIANVESAYGFANGVSVNTAASYRVANSAYNITNSSYGITNSVFFKTNSCYTHANSAFDRANTKINTANGVATGTFTVQGNHEVQGDVKFQGNTNTFEIIDGVIYINGIEWNPTAPGTVIYTASSSVPSGYLSADGSAISRTEYAALFAAIATTYGPGDGSTTFNLPDLRGLFIRGYDGGRGLDPDGREFGSYQLDLFKSHTHTDAGHRHNILNTGNNADGGGAGWLVNPQIDTGLQTVIGYADIQATGGSETRPKNIALLACIKY
jgi:microcystin-dependent protein